MAKKKKNIFAALLLAAGALFLSSSKKIYKASDGKVFNSKSEMEAYNQELEAKKEKDEKETSIKDPLITNPTTSNPNSTTNYRDSASPRGGGNSNANPSDQYGAGVNTEDREFHRAGDNNGYDRSANSHANNDGNDLSAEDFYEQRVFVSDATIQWFHTNDPNDYSLGSFDPSVLFGFNATFVIWAKLINMTDVNVRMDFINVKSSILDLEAIGVLRFLKYSYTLAPKSESQWLPIAYYDKPEIVYPLFDYKYLFRDLNLYYNKINLKESLYFLPARVFFRYNVYLPFDGFKVADCHSEFDTECLSIPVDGWVVSAYDPLRISRDGIVQGGEPGDILLDRSLYSFGSGPNMLNPEINTLYKDYLDLLRSPSTWNWNSKTYPIRYVIKKYRDLGYDKTAVTQWDRLVYGGEEYPQLGHLERVNGSRFPLLGIVYDQGGEFAYE